MEDTEKEVILVGGLVAGLYFFVVRPIMKNFGLDGESQETIDSLNTAQPDQNPFNINYIDSYIAEHGGDYIQIMPSDVNALKPLYDEGYRNIDKAVIWGEQIYDSFNWYGNINGEQLTAVFSQIPTKAAVCDVARYLYFTYNVDLLYLLRNGVFSILPNTIVSNGAPAGMVANFIKHVNSLPVGI